MLEDVDIVVGMLGRRPSQPFLSSSPGSPTALLRDVLTVVKGFRNGLVYGAKIRLPHALVMTLLFRPEPLLQKLRIVATLTRTHAWNLARFVAIYKTLLILLRRLHGERRWHPFVAGCVGGYAIFSSDSTVNNQIVLYLLARVLTGLVKLLYDKAAAPLGRIDGLGGRPPLAHPLLGFLGDHAFKMEATLVWGAVMYLFKNYRDTLQSSLQSSMQYLYNDSDTWRSLWTLLIHNK